jgi:cytohesin
MWAAAEGHSDTVQLLVERGADVKAVSKSGFNALLFAASKGDAKSVQGLLKAGADPNYTLRDGMTPLLVATAFEGDLAAAALLDAGANPKVADKTGATPLHTAAQLGGLDLVKKLIAKGADVNARTKRTPPPRRASFRFAPAGEQTPLLFAARANHVDVMKALVGAGADPSLKAQDGTTLLMAAAGSGHLEPVQLAYELAPDIKAVTDNGTTVMHSAVTFTLTDSTQEKVCKVVQFLADKGALLDEKNESGRTPIDIADILPIDKAVTLLTDLIVKSGATPKAPSKR